MRAVPADPPRSRREQVALLSLGLVAALTLANLAFNLIAARHGLGHPRSTFLGPPNDNFGDFFTLLTLYPHSASALVADRAGLHALLPPHPASMHAVSNPHLTNLHMMPLATMIEIALVAITRIVDPVVLFLSLVAALAGWWCALATRFAATRVEAAAWCATGLSCYPMLLGLSRGNLLALLCGLLLVNAMLLASAGRRPVVVAIMLAIACNIRPNALPLALPLLALFWPARLRFSPVLGGVGLAAALSSLAVAHLLYPAYSPASIVAGLRDYQLLYVVGNWGMPYNSSLYGALKFAVGDVPGLERAAMLTALILIGGATAGYAARRIDPAMLLFVGVVAVTLGTTILADYHLVALLAVPLALAAAPPASDPRQAELRRIVLVAVLLVLAPKNYLFVGSPIRPVSLQVLVNPLLLLVPALLVLIRAATGAVASGPARPQAAFA